MTCFDRKLMRHRLCGNNLGVILDNDSFCSSFLLFDFLKSICLFFITLPVVMRSPTANKKVPVGFSTFILSVSHSQANPGDPVAYGPTGDDRATVSAP